MKYGLFVEAVIIASIVLWIVSLIAVILAIVRLARGGPERRHLVALILVSTAWIGMGLMLAIGQFKDIDPPACWIALVPAACTLCGLLLNVGPANPWVKRSTLAIAACAPVFFLLIPGGGPVTCEHLSMRPPYPWFTTSSENPRVCVRIMRPGCDVQMYVLIRKPGDDDTGYECELFSREISWSVLERAPHAMAGRRGVRYVLRNDTPPRVPFQAFFEAFSGRRAGPYHYCWVVDSGRHTYDFVAYGPDRGAVVAQAESMFATVRFPSKD